MNLEHVEKQKKKAEDILQRKKWLEFAENELSKLSLDLRVTEDAKIRLFKGFNSEVNISFQITLPEIAKLLQKRVDMNKKELEKLLSNF